VGIEPRPAAWQAKAQPVRQADRNLTINSSKFNHPNRCLIFCQLPKVAYAAVGADENLEEAAGNATEAYPKSLPLLRIRLEQAKIHIPSLVSSLHPQ
jgi:hypothetical protein